ncbi:MAG: hypothetical protein LBR32_09995 [Propionibacteriaceae bacterium]|jgi:hypothetical protein|nr:hypothetical protein [Propionibacteriaceae bacterium]
MTPKAAGVAGDVRNAVRRLGSFNAHVNRGLNAAFERFGKRAYVELVELGEREDSIADVAGLRAIRERIARDGIELRYPNRLRSAARIYGIKPALFGDAAEAADTPAVEHGLFLGDYTYPQDTVYSAPMTCATFSPFRRVAIHKRQSQPVFCVGPYVGYAEPYYDRARTAAEKWALGRTLLVYPSHSTEDSAMRHDPQRFAWVEKAAAGFDSVLVSVHWWDLTEPYVDQLVAAGYRVVSSGMTHDRRFLSRQRTTLELADAVAGDGIGTHVGYAVALGKPFAFTGRRADAVVARRTRDERLDAEQARVHETIVAELEAAFAHPDGIGPEQLAAANKYWGLDQLKTPQQLADIRAITADLLAHTRGFVGLVPAAARRLLARYRADFPSRAELLADAMPAERA